MEEIGFGGSCHWCTEAVFQSLRGVVKVNQGWIAAQQPNHSFSEAVIVLFNPQTISLSTLIAVHLHSHSCTSLHSFRSKYRSAVYTFNARQFEDAQKAITNQQHEFEQPIITQVLPFGEFKLNQQNYLNYYSSNPDKPFCKNIINPKFTELRKRFGKLVSSA